MGPLIVQGDKTLLLEVAHPQAEETRQAIAPFAELERAPEHIHTYRLTDLGLWNARAAGHTSTEVCQTLVKYTRYPIPPNVLTDIAEVMDRYGRLTLERDGDQLVLRTTDQAVLREVQRSKQTKGLLGAQLSDTEVTVPNGARGALKQALVKLGWPADDQAGFVDGTPHPIALSQLAPPRGEGAGPAQAARPWRLREYQRQAVDAAWFGGSGVVVLPCGAGKTVVGAGVMAKTSATTLILVTNTVAARQWRDELLRFTTLRPEEIGEYSGARKEIKPITIATYQVMTTKRDGAFVHLDLLDGQDWGLIVYDEVHLLPAPIFRLTADLQARRRLGLTATLVREDGREDEVFSLIGPKRYDAPWKEIEAQGHIAPAVCTEVRLTLPDDLRLACATAEPNERYRLAATAPDKTAIVRRLVEEHPDDQVLVIGAYLSQLEDLSEALDAPLITGQTPVRERERLYAAFRTGEVALLVVSKVANFSIDLPEASVAIQVSGSFGSRQEEAQRLGRIMRPKADGRVAHFYTVVSRDTPDQEFAGHRQRFLAEQGYSYRIIDAEDL